MAEQPTLSRQEELFCGLCALLGNPVEAAARAGYQKRSALRAAVRLLGRAEIREEAARRAAEERERDRDRAMTGLLRLALDGCDGAPEGEPEIKAADRIKALELLLRYAGEERDAGAHSLYGALEKGAAALSGRSGGQGREGDAV